MREMRALIRKQHVWHHELERRARAEAGDVEDDDAEPPVPVPFPTLVALSQGLPRTVIEEYAFAAVGRGVYAAPRGLATRILVLSELPETPATVLLRLASGKRRAEAIAEILRMPEDAWERKTAVPFLVQFGMAAHGEASPEEQMTVGELSRQAEEAVRNVERSTERRVLLKLLRSRFGELPESTVARVAAAKQDDLDAWVDRILTAKSLPELFGDA